MDMQFMTVKIQNNLILLIAIYKARSGKIYPSWTNYM